MHAKSVGIVKAVLSKELMLDALQMAYEIVFCDAFDFKEDVRMTRVKEIRKQLEDTINESYEEVVNNVLIYMNARNMIDTVLDMTDKEVEQFVYNVLIDMFLMDFGYEEMEDIPTEVRAYD